MTGAALALIATLGLVIPSAVEGSALHRVQIPRLAALARDDGVSIASRITLDVDATDVERGIFRVRETIQVTRAGRLTLLFPKWVPGNHAPTARIERLAGLVMRA